MEEEDGRGIELTSDSDIDMEEMLTPGSTELEEELRIIGVPAVRTLVIVFEVESSRRSAPRPPSKEAEAEYSVCGAATVGLACKDLTITPELKLVMSTAEFPPVG